MKNISLIRQNTSNKVFLGMSGGVDSSVSAALLQKAGYDVTGVFIKVWQPDWVECTWKQDRLDALRVAAVLGIPFITLDLEAEYKREVVDYMVREYGEGRTPNPDVMCNQHVKFGAFLDWAMAQGADYVATGHYVQKTQRKNEKGEMVEFLAKGNDPTKDQSYFLWTLRAEQIPKVLFPVGDIEKTEVRKLAEKFGLPTAAKKDSQGLCFIGKVDIKEFLSHFISPKKGDAVITDGTSIGSHDGAVFLTIGQRHGFTITAQTPDEKPYFIVSKDMAANTITVSHTPPREDMQSTVVRLTATNWPHEFPKEGVRYEVRARYRQELVGCTFRRESSLDGTTTWVAHPEAALGAAAGQSLVVYEGTICRGGGVIL